MSNNNLSGPIPSEVSLLSSLMFFIVSKSNLSGELPSSLQNCSSLASLDLAHNRFSGNIPASTGGSITSLLILRLRSNLFSREIPTQICHLSNLHIVDLSHNSLSGSIPVCIGNLTGLKVELTNADRVRYQGRLTVVAKGKISSIWWKDSLPRQQFGSLRQPPVGGDSWKANEPREVVDLEFVHKPSHWKNTGRHRELGAAGDTWLIKQRSLGADSSEHDHFNKAELLEPVVQWLFGENPHSQPVPKPQWAIYLQGQRWPLWDSIGRVMPGRRETATIYWRCRWKQQEQRWRRWSRIFLAIPEHWARFLCWVLWCLRHLVKKSWREAYYGYLDRMKNKLTALSARWTN